MKKLFYILSILTICIFSFSEAAAEEVCQKTGPVCKVTTANGNANGSLYACLNLGTCSVITFDTEEMGTDEVILDSSISLIKSTQNYITIDGAIDSRSRVKIKGDLGVSPLFRIFKSGITFQNLIMTNKSGPAVKILGMNNTFQNCEFRENQGAVLISAGQNNNITGNSFYHNYTYAILLTNGGNNNLSAPTINDAEMISDTMWSLTGIVDESTTKIEIYEADNSSIAQGQRLVMLADVKEGEFSADLNIDIEHPSQNYIALAFDETNNTSSFSNIFNPLEDASDFFGKEYSACKDSNWFLDEENGGWQGDFDGDGVINGQEDENHNCVIDGIETDPANSDDSNPDQDLDDDGIEDSLDNCLNTPNSDQEDYDEDGLGDECDTDIDGDGNLNEDDNCPMMSNASQKDLDEDGIGNLCDDDADNDDILNEDDNCPMNSNPSQTDTDGDGIGNACDNNSGDFDGDGIIDTEDNCPYVINYEQSDEDGDGIGDDCDEDFSIASANTSKPGGCSIAASSESNLFAILILLGSIIAFPFSLRKLWGNEDKRK